MLAQHLVREFNAVIASGKKADVFNQALIHSQSYLHIKVAVMDVPREAQDYVHYGTIEQLKNGMIYSGKYEGGIWSQARDKSPHIVCFSNDRPKTEKMSKDRWHIYKINGQELEEEKEYEYVNMQESNIDF